MEVLLRCIEEAERELIHRERCIERGLDDPGRTPYRASSQVRLDNYHFSYC